MHVKVALSARGRAQADAQSPMRRGWLRRNRQRALWCFTHRRVFVLGPQQGRRGGRPRTLLPAAKRRRAPLVLRGRASRSVWQAVSSTTKSTSPISLVNPRSGGLWAIKRDDRRAAFARRSLCKLGLVLAAVMGPRPFGSLPKMEVPHPRTLHGWMPAGSRCRLPHAVPRCRG